MPHWDETPERIPGDTERAIDAAIARRACAHRYEFNRYCAATVCIECDDHKGFARCFCGWARSGGNGYRELIEMGETIEPEY